MGKIAEREFLVATEAGGKQVKAPGAIAKFESELRRFTRGCSH